MSNLLFSIARKFSKILEGEKGLVYVTVGHMGSVGLGAVFWIAMAVFAPTVSDYGSLNYSIAWASIIGGVSSVGMHIVLMTYLPKGKTGFLSEASGIVLVASVAGFAILLYLDTLVSAFIALGFASFTMSVGQLLGEKKYKEFAIVSVLSKTVQLVLGLVLFTQYGVIGALIAFGVAQLAFSYRYFWSLRNVKFRFPLLKEKRNFVFHTIGVQTIATMALSLDKVIVGHFFNFDLLGQYQLSFQFLLMLSIFPVILKMYLLPENASGNSRKNVAISGLILAVFLVILVSLSAEWLISSFFPNYFSVIDELKIMSIALIPITVTSIYAAKSFGEEKTRIIFLSSISFLIVMLLGIMTLGAAYGLTGLAISVVISFSIQAGVLLLPVKKIRASEQTEKDD